MTLITIVLLGAGVLFVASALDNTPLVQTFQKILNGDPINWAGAGEIAKDKGPRTGVSDAPGVPGGGAIDSTLLGNQPVPPGAIHKS